ncbi:MAG: hypothetical protein S4CHLAM6_13180 [Chlamydiae bacterium]|nr:hypothetical protein [Chlamydiota bacterium]
MKIIPRFVDEWLYPHSASESEIIAGLTLAKFKEVASLASEQSLLNDLYSPFPIEHPTKLSVKASELIHLFSYTEASKQLEKTHKISLYQFQQQSEKDKVKSLLYFPINGKNLLKHIGFFLDPTPPSFILPIDPNSPFNNSDLVVYANNYYGPLPPNGIYQKDLSRITSLYNQISNGETALKIQGSFGFQLHVLSAVKKLMTRSRGRELLYSILKPGWIQYFKGLFSGATQTFTIDIFPHNSTSFVNCLVTRNQGFVFTVNLCEKVNTQVYVEQTGKANLQTEKNPFYISLAHELIHIRHSLFGRHFKTANSVELHKFTNENEKVAITGKLNGKEEDNISENSIREEFNFLPRSNHQGVTVDYYSI